MKQTYKAHAKVFKAFCDEKRLAILALLRGGEKCACVLIEKTGMAQSAISYHMKILCESGVVAARQEGKWTHYRLSAEGAHTAAALLTRLTTLDAGEEESCKC